MTYFGNRPDIPYLRRLVFVIVFFGVAQPITAHGGCRDDARTSVTAARDYQHAAREVIKACSGTDVTALLACDEAKSALETALELIGGFHEVAITSCVVTLDEGEARPVSIYKEIIVTEIMANPGAVADTHGEWFEVKNLSGEPLQLQGATFATGSGVYNFTISESLIIGTDDYAVFGNNANTSTNGGVLVDYEYTTIFPIGNNGATVEMYAADGSTLIDYAYVDVFNREGFSYQLDDYDQWCDTPPSGGSILPGGDKGTPGAANLICLL